MFLSYDMLNDFPLFFVDCFRDFEIFVVKYTHCTHRFIHISGADPENIKTWGRNCINYQAEPGGANLFCCLTYKGEQGACAG